MPSSKRPRILLLIPHLGGGGSERVIETLAQCLNRAKYDIHLGLVTTSQKGSPRLYSTVTVHEVRSTRVRRASIRLLRLIWRLRPNFILSGIAHLNLLVLALKPLLPSRTRIVVRQNGTVAATLAAHSRLLSRRAYSLGYRQADRVICQTDSMSRDIHRGLGVHPSKLLVLPNPIDLLHIRSSCPPNQDLVTIPATLLSIGRLVPEKGLDILLDAFASLSLPYHSTKLIIVGTGPEQARLEQQTEALDIGNRVHFTGHVPDPIIRFHQSSLFVLSSRTEGLPNAMLEAAAAGIPIVATPACSGVVDLIKNREGVWLAAEITSDALRAALEAALSSTQPGARYAHAWVEPYDLSCAIPAYESFIDRVMAGTV